MKADPTILPAVRSQITQAEEKLRIALRLMLDGGWVETHPYLLSIHKQLMVWTQKDGWLDWLEKPEAEDVKKSLD